MIITERLKLMPFNQALLEAAVLSDEKVFEESGLKPNTKWFASDIRTRANGFLSLMALGGKDEVLPWMIVLKNSNEVIGDIGFLTTAEEAILEIGYGVSKPYRRKHYASEAIRALTFYQYINHPTLHGIRANVEKVNEASHHCITAAGYKETACEGHLKTYRFDKHDFERWYRQMSPNGIVLASACLLDYTVRYSAEPLPNAVLASTTDLMADAVKVPCCPEQLGGLSTPRSPVEFLPAVSRYINQAGEDVSDAFERGAQMVIKMAEQLETHFFMLKQSSPSCGSVNVYDGTFSGRKISGSGCTVKKIMMHFEKYIIMDENGHMIFKA
ncbi:GNAT family N-acetyltransferase [Fusibacter paucivorans]|uniref:GNAT family N-acetyltransferase n=1 Tax=Fusibacter paucivorans TaxID=76009 RepID=A0ABS5PKI8_9FIRM|nr:GNAT family N-acetyltransferase [Fusibacter paucivorans]MBS7525644.1 GNAT family N-acetyltransferase [Fusibacter paucivorans]